MSKTKNNEIVSSETKSDYDDSAGVPRRFNRSRQRMFTYNKDKVFKKNTNLGILSHEFKTQSVLEQQKDETAKKPRFRKAAEGTVKAKTPSAPSNLPAYEGQCHGLHAAHFTNSHNFDFSTFPIIARELHQMLTAKETNFTRSLPYCAFQHYLAVILNAVLIKRVMTQNVESRFSSEQDPFDVISADTLWIPSPFLNYINGIGSNLLQNGDRVYLNLPVGGTPQGTFQLGDVVIPSGTFGACNVEQHNAYECYVSPYVTSNLIIRTREAFGHQDQLGAWMPLPLDLVPLGARATPNLLGYELPESIRGETMNILQRFNFANEDSMPGRLRFSAELMQHVSGLLHERSDRFKMIRGVPIDSPINPAAFISSRVNVPVLSTDRLASKHGSLDSCEASGASSSNMASYFGYRRIRTELAPGYCMVAEAGNIAGWNATINNNYNMVNPFNPVFGEDFAFLRDIRFSESSLSGTREANVRLWLDKDFTIRI